MMNTLSKKKHVDWVKLQNLNNEQLIQAVLNWDEMQYCEFKYEAGIAYAKRMTDNDVIGFDVLIQTRFFWQWWKNEWAKRDDEFLMYYSSTANKALLHDQYLFQHSIPRLKSDELMERKACSMVGYCLDEHLKNEKHD
jgi:hypothetical protein